MISNSMLADIMQSGRTDLFSAADSDCSHGSQAATDGGFSFGDILSNVQMLNGMNFSAAAISENEKTADAQALSNLLMQNINSDEKLSFAELIDALSQKISAADNGTIDAATMLLEMQGKAAAAIFGTDNANDFSLSDVFDSILKIQNVDADDGINALQILGDTSDLISTGLNEGETADQITDTLEDILSKNQSGNTSLANAVMSAIYSFSAQDGTNSLNTDITAAENNNSTVQSVSNNGLAKLADLLDTLGADNDGSVLKLIGFNGAEKDNTVQNIHNPLAAGVSNVKINDVKEQVSEINGLTVKQNTADADFQTVKADITAQNVTDNGKNGKNDKDNFSAAVINVNAAANAPKQTAEAAIAEKEEFTEEKLYDTIEQLSNPISDALKSSSDNGTSELTVVLKPENLGEVAVKLVTEKGVVSVVISAQNPEVGKALSENASALAENIAKRGAEVSTVNVVPPSDAGFAMGLDFTNQGFNRKNDGQNSNPSSSTKVNAIDETDNVKNTDKTLIQKEAALWVTA